MKEKKWRIELTEHQLNLMAQCVEDCHRFMAGQMELQNTTCNLDRYRELCIELGKLQPLVTPGIGIGTSYDWAGNHCPNERQRKFIAETYYLYRRIYEANTKERAKTEDLSWCVYNDDTLRCELSGEPIKVERVE